MRDISDKVIGRLSLYRRLLTGMLEEGKEEVHSHELARRSGGTAAQVRRDLMATGYTGNARRGYKLRELLAAIGDLLGDPGDEVIAVVGIGKVGRALMDFFLMRKPQLPIRAGFDIDPGKVGRIIHGCRCYPVDRLADVCRDKGVTVGIITVPAAVAQEVADALVSAGVRALINFAPVRLHVPPGVYVEHVDMTILVEKAAFFARRGGEPVQ